MKKLSGLGLGLGSLIPKNSPKASPTGKDTVFYIEVHKIRPNSNQPRRDFDAESLNELATSIKKYGILQPIIVSKVAQETSRGMDVDYEIVAGERRWRGAQLANLTQVPVIIKENFDEGRVKLEVALIENIQRENLNALEEAQAYARLSEEFGLKHHEIAEKVGKSRELVTNTLRLLDLPQEMQKALLAQKMTRSQARSLLLFKNNPKKQKQMFQQLMLGNLSTGDMEQIAKEDNNNRKYGGQPVGRFDDLQENLSKTFSTPVIIRSGANGGSIQIKFTNLEHLNNIVKTLLD